MRRSLIGRWLWLATILMPAPVLASTSIPAPVQLTYRGGPLIEHAQVSTLYWGAGWKESSLTGYFNSFFQALFADGRYMANLTQYSAGGYQIGNGTLASSTTDEHSPPSIVHDSQIRAEIRAQIAAHNLPLPTKDTIYVVFTPPHTEVVDQYGTNSVQDFVSYHDYAFGSDGFAYVVIPYDDTLQDARRMTAYTSGSLAAAVTDPEASGTAEQVGWYDDNYGEVETIPFALAAINHMSTAGLFVSLVAADGTTYVVADVWSNKDTAPVAFATPAGP